MKQEFLNFLNALMEASPDLTNSLMTDTIKFFFQKVTVCFVIVKFLIVFRCLCISI